MSKVKLELQNKNDIQLRVFATEHKTAITGNVNFPMPNPLAAAYDAALLAYSNKLDAIAAAENSLAAMRAEKDTLRAALEDVLTARGHYVEMTAAGDDAKILSAGFGVRAAASPTSQMPLPQGVAGTIGDNEGEIDLLWHPVRMARSYIIESREHSETAAPGAWQQAKVTSRSSATVGGLVSGRKYAFRVRAIGPNDLLGPWSDETVCMAA